MATYTPSQIRGAGTLGENLSGTKTFTFQNGSTSTSYFVLEAIRTPDGFYSGSLPIVGTFSVSESMEPGFVTSSFMFACAVPAGTSSLTFTPTGTVSGSNYRLRGAGDLTLIIS